VGGVAPVGEVDDGQAELIPLDQELDLSAAETLIGQPPVDPYDAVYKDLRASKGTNILEHAERALIARALEDAEGKQVKAAEILGMTRATLRKRIDQYDLG
jgi:DNA-binding protein Fis